VIWTGVQLFFGFALGAVILWCAFWLFGFATSVVAGTFRWSRDGPFRWVRERSERDWLFFFGSGLVIIAVSFWAAAFFEEVMPIAAF
jgi:hypothetical protein